jgi:hypothetical protein
MRLGPVLLVLLGLVADAAGAPAPIYRLDHPDRAPEFTDRPPQQLNPPVTLGAPSAFPALRAPRFDGESGAVPTAASPRSELSSEAAPRPAITILSPGPGEAIRANNGAIPLSLALRPALTSEERLRLSLDGEVLRTAEAPPAMLEGLARGEHTLLIERLDQEGRALADAQRTFYVLRTALGRTP